jgi:hypothetical protein
MKRRKTYKTNVTGGYKERSAGHSNESQLPDEGKTKDGAGDDGRNGLNDAISRPLIMSRYEMEWAQNVRSQSDTSKTVNFLSVVTQACSQSASLKNSISPRTPKGTDALTLFSSLSKNSIS